MAEGPMSPPRRPAPRSRPAPITATVRDASKPSGVFWGDTGKAYVQAMGDAPIKGLLADDDGAFLEALRALIDRQPELDVVAAARNGLEAIELAEVVAPDAIV